MTGTDQTGDHQQQQLNGIEMTVPRSQQSQIYHPIQNNTTLNVAQADMLYSSSLSPNVQSYEQIPSKNCPDYSQRLEEDIKTIPFWYTNGFH